MGIYRQTREPNRKAELRKLFHSQLELLWQQDPLVNISKYIDSDYKPDECYLGERRGSTIFYPIVSEKIWTIAELDILMLRPGEPGSIWVGGGDIDNRLKTLFDSLKVPDMNSGDYHAEHPRMFLPAPGRQVNYTSIRRN